MKETCTSRSFTIAVYQLGKVRKNLWAASGWYLKFHAAAITLWPVILCF